MTQKQSAQHRDGNGGGKELKTHKQTQEMTPRAAEVTGRAWGRNLTWASWANCVSLGNTADLPEPQFPHIYGEAAAPLRWGEERGTGGDSMPPKPPSPELSLLLSFTTEVSRALTMHVSCVPGSISSALIQPLLGQKTECCGSRGPVSPYHSVPSS